MCDSPAADTLRCSEPRNLKDASTERLEIVSEAIGLISIASGAALASLRRLNRKAGELPAIR